MNFDCQSCGACCHGLDVSLTETEESVFRRDPKLEPLTQLEAIAPGWEARFMRRDGTNDRCVALSVLGPRCHCTIYDRRPQLCRELEPGSESCLEARRRAGLPDVV
jgi:uncharacterized protein